MGGLILICSVVVAMGQCWPSRADAMFTANESELEQPEHAVAQHRIDMHKRYIVVRNIACGPEAANISHDGEHDLPAGCRDIGFNGHCPSPLYKGKCPN